MSKEKTTLLSGANLFAMQGTGWTILSRMIQTHYGGSSLRACKGFGGFVRVRHSVPFGGTPNTKSAHPNQEILDYGAQLPEFLVVTSYLHPAVRAAIAVTTLEDKIYDPR